MLQSVRKFLWKHLFFQTQKVASTSYYGIEDPFPDLNLKTSPFQGEYEVPIVGLSKAIGSQNAMILMLRRLLLL